MTLYFMKYTTLLASIWVLCGSAVLSPLNASLVDLPQYGFQIEALDAKSGDSAVSALMMFLPPSDGFAPNINIQIQPYAGTIKEYVALSKGQFEQMKWKLISEKENGANAWVAEYAGTMQDKDLHFYARALLKEGKIYLATATAKESQWATVGPTLRERVNSFKTK